MSMVSKECQFECGEIVYHRADANRTLKLFIVQREVHDCSAGMSVRYLCRECASDEGDGFAMSNPWNHGYWETELTL